jgi:hypothetical protein
MKVAVSMRLGGDPVPAKDADYNTYKVLGMVCPNCHSPVFLSRGGTASVQGKEIKREPFWSHFPGKDSQECELRVRRMIADGDLKAESSSRGQREKILRDWSHQVILKYMQKLSLGLRGPTGTGFEEEALKDFSLDKGATNSMAAGFLLFSRYMKSLGYEEASEPDALHWFRMFFMMFFIESIAHVAMIEGQWLLEIEADLVTPNNCREFLLFYQNFILDGMSYYEQSLKRCHEESGKSFQDPLSFMADLFDEVERIDPVRHFETCREILRYLLPDKDTLHTLFAKDDGDLENTGDHPESHWWEQNEKILSRCRTIAVPAEIGAFGMTLTGTIRQLMSEKYSVDDVPGNRMNSLLVHPAEKPVLDACDYNLPWLAMARLGFESCFYAVIFAIPWEKEFAAVEAAINLEGDQFKGSSILSKSQIKAQKKRIRKQQRNQKLREGA